MVFTLFLRNRAVARVAWMLALLLMLQPLVLIAAQAQDDCAAKLKDAEQKFYNGDFDSSITLIKECLAKPDFPLSKKTDAYELLAQNYLAKSYLSEARNAIRKLLELVPTYAPPKDSPELVAEVEDVRKEISEEKKPVEAPVPKQARPAEESGFPKTWHWIAGGAVLTGVVLAIVLSGGKNEGAVPTAELLPGPPGLP